MMRKILYLLYQPYKWLIYVPLLVLLTCLFVALGIIIIWITDDTVGNRTTGVWWSRSVSYITPMLVRVIGRENIQKNQSYIVVANHQSHYDILILYGWLGIDLKWVIKKELRKIPVFGYAGEKGGNIFIDRHNKKEAYEILAKAKNKIVNGTSIIILPEGTRSRTGHIGEFKKGPFWMALQFGIPILPVTIVNTRKILPPRGFRLFPGRAAMMIHEPIDINRYDEESLNRLIGDVKAVIEGGLERFEAGNLR